MATMLLVTCVNPQINVPIRAPLRSYYLPLAVGNTLEVGSFAIRGPVSAYPHGLVGGGLEIYTPDTRFARWNSFNLGELVFPHSWLSALPLIAALVGLTRWLFRTASRADLSPSR